jgi:dipeptidyl-peptidase-4
MIKKLMFIGLLFIGGGLIAQEKLTLEDAVMQQYRKFYPDNITGFSWIPNSTSFSYLEGYKTLKKGSAANPEAEEWLTIDEVNKALKSKLSWFSGFEWKNEKEFYLNDGENFYLFDTSSKKGKLISAIGEKAKNANLHNSTGHVAYTKGNNLYVQTADMMRVRVTAEEDLNIVSGQAIARSEFGISGGIFWSPTGSKIAYYQKNESDVHDYPLLDNNEYPGMMKMIKYPMAGQQSEKSAVGIYDIASGETQMIYPLGDPEDYLTNVSWTPDNKFLLIAEVNRGQNHMKLQLYDASNGKFIRTILEEKSEKWVEPEHPAFFPNTSKNEFVWVSEKSGFANLYFYDLNGKLIRQLTDNKFICKEILKATKNGTQIYYSATGDSPLNMMVYQVDLKGKQQLITSEPGTHQVSISNDGEFIFDQYSSHSIPNIACIYNAKGKKKSVLLESKNKYEGVDIGTTEISSITAKDGSKLYTRMIKPKDFDATKKYPVLIYVYGGPHAQMITNSWLDGASLWMHWMADQGYIVYTVDNRGSAHRGFAFESQIHRQFGTVEMEDQLSGVEYLKSLPFVDANRLAVHGWSFGGFMTTSLMLRQPGTFNVGVAGGPVIDWKFYEIMYGERYMDRPEENPEGYEANSLLNYADKLEGKLLLIHGTVDDVVVMQHSLSMIQKFVESGVQMDFFPYPMHPHNVRGKDRVHLMNKVLNYVIENNK